MKIGIDKIGFYAPHMYIDMVNLAEARGDDPLKYTKGIGQDEMAVNPVTQDTVTMAANAALQLIDEEDRKKIDFVIFGTETGIDQSKAGAVYVNHLLGLKKNVRAIETKQACYGATAAIQLGKGHIALNPDSKVLVLASDIARYGLATPGEVTQGAGAVAILLSKDPKIMTLEHESTYQTDDIMDFWRPVYSDVAIVDGKYSNDKYIEFFSDVWSAYKEKTNRDFADFDAICFHLPYTRMGEKALRPHLESMSEDVKNRLENNYKISTTYNRIVGNIYTGSLYLSLLSLLENQTDLKAGARIGMYSYGSGSVGEFFTGILEKDFKKHLNTNNHKNMMDNRKEVTVDEYEEEFLKELPTDGSTIEYDGNNDPASIYLSGIKDHMRQYKNKQS